VDPRKPPVGAGAEIVNACRAAKPRCGPPGGPGRRPKLSPEQDVSGYDIGLSRAIKEWLQMHHALWAVTHQPQD